MNMLGNIGTFEMVVFLVIVLIIFGPKNLPRLAQSIGRSARELKNGLAGIGDDLKEDDKENGTAKRDAKPAPTVNRPEEVTVERVDTPSPGA